MRHMQRILSPVFRSRAHRPQLDFRAPSAQISEAQNIVFLLERLQSYHAVKRFQFMIYMSALINGNYIIRSIKKQAMIRKKRIKMLRKNCKNRQYQTLLTLTAGDMWNGITCRTSALYLCRKGRDPRQTISARYSTNR